jgi:hypothetical protein
MLDKAAPVYTGRDTFLRQVAEYEHYLREQTEHELKLLQKKATELQEAIDAVRELMAAEPAEAAVEEAEIPAYSGDEEVTEDNGV